jgi:hypothetical protein
MTHPLVHLPRQVETRYLEVALHMEDQRHALVQGRVLLQAKEHY